jgi:hypothetical protein
VREDCHSQVKIYFDYNAGIIAVQVEKVDLLGYLFLHQPAPRIAAHNFRRRAVQVVCDYYSRLIAVRIAQNYLPQFAIVPG